VDVLAFNSAAWDKEVGARNVWTVPVDHRRIERARRGDWSIVVTPRRAVPKEWFPPLEGASVLCLASGGGQQGPILSAAGAHVTVLDASEKQLDQDRRVAEREGLTIDTVCADMADLSIFEDETFDLIVNPCSNCFAESVRPIWRECFRILKGDGVLIAGFANPLLFCFDRDKEREGILEIRYSVPFSDVTSLTDDERVTLRDADEPLLFGHSFEDQIGGQIDQGFVIVGLYEDYHLDDDITVPYFPAFVATRARKPS
jgi:SAM-dependent methyltransferase